MCFEPGKSSMKRTYGGDEYPEPKKQKLLQCPYFDYNNIAPMADEVSLDIKNALREFCTDLDSSDENIEMAKIKVGIARRQIAQMIGAEANEVSFTVSISDGIKKVILNIVDNFISNQRYISEKPHVVASSIESLEIKLTLSKLSEENVIDVTFVPCYPKNGTVLVDDLLSETLPRTCLVCLAMANGVTGVIQPVEALSMALRNSNISAPMGDKCRPFLYSDLSQAIGKIKVDVCDLNVDLATVNGTKFYGPGISAIYIKSDFLQKNLKFDKEEQKHGMQPSVDNAPFMIGLGRAAAMVCRNKDFCNYELQNLRDYFQTRLLEDFEDTFVMQHFNFGPKCLPNIICISFKSESDFEKIKRITFLKTNLEFTKRKEFKNILKDLRIPENLIPLTISLSVGRTTRFSDIDFFIRTLKEQLEN